MRPIRSFVLREGRLTPAQERALDELMPRYGIDPGPGAIDFTSVFGRDAPVWLEIGFGNGDALRQMAAQHPEIDFVGIEVHRPGIGHLLRALEHDGLDNVRILRGDAAEILAANIGDAALARVLIFFPDPWPKKRHHKRRLIQPGLVDELARVLEPGGIVHLATDWDDYARHMRALLERSPAFASAGGGRAGGADYRPRTRFQRRGENRGHAVHDLLYVRSGTQPAERA